MNREQYNSQFDFLRPQHHLFQYFTRLVEQFTKAGQNNWEPHTPNNSFFFKKQILIPSRDLVDRLKKEAQDSNIVIFRIFSFAFVRCFRLLQRCLNACSIVSIGNGIRNDRRKRGKRRQKENEVKKTSKRSRIISLYALFFYDKSRLLKSIGTISFLSKQSISQKQIQVGSRRGGGGNQWNLAILSLALGYPPPVTKEQLGTRILAQQRYDQLQVK